MPRACRDQSVRRRDFVAIVFFATSRRTEDRRVNSLPIVVIAYCTCLFFLCVFFVFACGGHASCRSTAPPHMWALRSVTYQHASVGSPSVFVGFPGAAQSMAVPLMVPPIAAISIPLPPQPIPVFQMPSLTVPTQPLQVSHDLTIGDSPIGYHWRCSPYSRHRLCRIQKIMSAPWGTPRRPGRWRP